MPGYARVCIAAIQTHTNPGNDAVFGPKIFEFFDFWAEDSIIAYKYTYK